MAVKQNGIYYDPAFASAFDNLAEAFSGPKAIDVLAYAKAGAERQKASQLKYLFDNPTDPQFDRRNIAVGNYTPVQSYYAQDQNNATDLRKNSATNAANIQIGREKNASDLAKVYAAPIIVSDGQTAFLPDQTAAATGLSPQLRGNITAKPGDTITAPGGEVFKGAPKQLTDSEVKGAILQGLPQPEQRAVAMQGVGTTNVTGKDGEPVVEFTPNAVGKTPYEKDTSARQLGTYKTPTGEGNAYFDREKNKWIDSQTGIELPPNAPVKSITGGTQVNIDTKAPSKIEDAYGEGIGGQIKTTLDNAGNAPRTLAEIAQLRDAVNRAGDNITTGPLSAYVLKAKQAVGGLTGSSLDGVPEAELINNIGFRLATQASKAISSRPTQFEFGQALATKPGLALSKPGMHAMLNIMEQNAKDDQALAVLANDPANRQNWTATVQKYYAEHPVMSPFEPGKPLDQTDLARLEAAAPQGAQPPAGSGAPAAASAEKPKTVTQNGHTYTLQPDGSYK
ncbi:hypothetical protein ACRQ5Q_24250 [Bradyrhizobium sp. PMVTL-01]|uniref:hypothetical protein n=1 Tax=Bradyrhizobium sp. PMVTL-01 TaxID=3434999 RepID=UPI003F730FAC